MKNKDVIRNINDEGLAVFLTLIMSSDDTSVNSIPFKINMEAVKKYLNEETSIPYEYLKKYIDMDRLRNK